MELQELKKLIRKYNTGQASAEEKALVEEWYARVNGKDANFSSEAQREMLKQQINAGLTAYTSDRQESNTESNRIHQIRPVYSWMKWAAVLLMALGISLYLYLNNHSNNPKQQVAVIKADKKYNNDIKPGGNKATLTLADGSKIILNDVNNGVLANQGNTAISKTQDGQLVYKTSGSKRQAPAATLNSISTPRGGQYRIILPDGTKVWLNAASSLKFPTAFTGKERNVELSGEAYFEVAKNKKMPFRVKAGNTRIEVLGTHFNIMAYADEESQETTLLEGSVKVSLSSTVSSALPEDFGSSRILAPGQQARIADNLSVINVIHDVDTDYITAWKDGIFLFDNTGIEKVMQQVGRWYDVEIVYEGDKPGIKFTGVIPRSGKVSKLLSVLESAGEVKFDIEGNKIIVRKSK